MIKRPAIIFQSKHKHFKAYYNGIFGVLPKKQLSHALYDLEKNKELKLKKAIKKCLKSSKLPKGLISKKLKNKSFSS